MHIKVQNMLILLTLKETSLKPDKRQKVRIIKPPSSHNHLYYVYMCAAVSYFQ